MDKATLTRVAAKAGEYAALAAVIGFVGSLWIDREVERRMAELLPEPQNIGQSAPVVELSTKVDNVLKGQEAAATERQQIITRVDGLYTVMYDFINGQAQ